MNQSIYGNVRNLLIVLLGWIFPCYAISYSFATIDTPGFYKLANNVANQITITVPNVTLDMNGCTVSGGASGIVVNSSLTNVTIRNGTVNSVADGILINAGCKDIILKEITVKNCIRGITFDHVTTGIVSDCDLVLNTTGFHSDTSHNIVVENCMASANLQAAYSLLSSTTCTFLDCKALATGDGNTSSFGFTSNVFGFVTSNGRGNIFERCIANSTQELTATTANSIAAGFALLGTEGCSKIINCEAANATTSPTGFAIPYGIMLQAQFDGLVSVTSINPGDGLSDDQVLASNWSPDGNFLAIGGILNGIVGDDVYVYRFDRTNQVLIRVASTGLGGATADEVDTVQWSPDGQYLAVGGFIDIGNSAALYIYKFDNVTGTLTLIITVNPDAGSTVDQVLSLSWSSDGNFLAVGGTIAGATNDDLLVYQFDRVFETLTQVAAVNPNNGGTGDTVFAVDFSLDGQYLAVGGNISGTTNFDLFVYKIDRSTGFHITQIVALNPDNGGTSDQIRTVEWSPDGNYLAVGRTTTIGESTNNLFMYRFNRVAQTLTQVDAVDPSGTSGSITTLNWSSDGLYLVVGGSALFMYTFDRTTEKLIKLQTTGTVTVSTVQWSPDGNYVAAGGNFSGNPGNDLFIYSGLQFPQNNVIVGNTVYCNTGNRYQGGVGISGSSILNLIIGNNAYNNPFNYQFVTNVFDQLFGEGPSELQNITVANNQPITIPDDIPTRIKRTQLLLESLVDNLL